MKQLLYAALIGAFFLSVGNQTHAQNIRLGLRGGLNVSNFSGDFNNLENDALVGFHLGANLEFKLGNTISLLPEASFSTQGFKLKDASGNVDEYKVNYVNLPVMLRLRSMGGFYFEAGPQFGFKTGENIQDNTIENFAKGLDLSAAAGIGFISKGGFGLGARYIAGISKVGDFDNNNINPDFKNSVIQISLMLRLFK